jgi:hypothetical protein
MKIGHTLKHFPHPLKSKIDPREIKLLDPAIFLCVNGNEKGAHVERSFSAFLAGIILCASILSGLNAVDAKHPVFNELTLLLIPLIFLYYRPDYFQPMESFLKRIFIKIKSDVNKIKNVISKLYVLLMSTSSSLSERTKQMIEADRVAIQMKEAGEAIELSQSVNCYSHKKQNLLETKNKEKLFSTYVSIAMTLKITG